MTKQDIRKQVFQLLDSGMPKAQVFERLSGQGIRDNVLALIIGTYPCQKRYTANEKYINLLMGLMVFYAVIRVIFAVDIVKANPQLLEQFGVFFTWLLPMISAAVPMLFAWGFYKHRAFFYNFYILFTCLQLSNIHLDQLDAKVVFVLIFSVATFAYVWWLRARLFPDLFLISPNKQDGKFVFTDN